MMPGIDHRLTAQGYRHDAAEYVTAQPSPVLLPAVGKKSRPQRNRQKRLIECQAVTAEKQRLKLQRRDIDRIGVLAEELAQESLARKMQQMRRQVGLAYHRVN